LSHKGVYRFFFKVSPFLILRKTHIDVLEDFDATVIDRLQELSEKHKFLIFEDRKFADIGTSVVAFGWGKY